MRIQHNINPTPSRRGTGKARGKCKGRKSGVGEEDGEQLEAKAEPDDDVGDELLELAEGAGTSVGAGAGTNAHGVASVAAGALADLGIRKELPGSDDEELEEVLSHAREMHCMRGRERDEEGILSNGKGKAREDAYSSESSDSDAPAPEAIRPTKRVKRTSDDIASSPVPSDVPLSGADDDGAGGDRPSKETGKTVAKTPEEEQRRTRKRYLIQKAKMRHVRAEHEHLSKELARLRAEEARIRGDTKRAWA